ncbi:MAG: U32 family peptidase [Deltaproteobacteria bacterium]|nr:MAG: U32 family peptidase [Deltaproteobacteria bacterium]
MPTTTAATRPELLAPAGSLEAFFAALDSGADAVYLGLKDFSARAKAKNFTLQDLEKMLAYAHGQQRRVYVTLNTLVKECELPQLVETLAALEALAVDAVILQDLAVWRLARRHFPALELHASTQLTIHNVGGVRMLEQMGFTRVVLARELSLEEIAAIRRETTIGLEHFVHGAHCFSLSGQCSFSSWLGGMSGNRGRCAQPCRRRYRHAAGDGYHFSPNDLSAIELLPELAAAGISSLKIEGRMKSAEYVASVVRAYRRVLDAPAAARQGAVAAAREQLKGSFGRSPTRGFLAGPAPGDMVQPHLHGATGRMLGRLEVCAPGRMTFVSREPLQKGDRLRVQPVSDRPGTGFTIRDLSLGRRPVTRTEAGARVTVGTPPDAAFRKGDMVFQVASGETATASEASCRKRLARVRLTPGRVTLTVAFPDAASVELTATAPGVTLTRRYPVSSYPASDRPLSADSLAKVFGRTGDTPFTLGTLHTGVLPAVVVPPSELNAVRRQFYLELAAAFDVGREQARSGRLAQARADLLAAGAPRPVTKSLVCVGLGAPRDLHLLRDPAVDEVTLPLTPGALARLETGGRGDARRVERLLWELPPAIFDADVPAFRSEIAQLAGRGFRRFRLQNLGQFPLFADLAGVELEAGARLFSLNSQALLAWRELGCSSAVACLEDDRENLADLLRRPAGIPLAVTVYANPVLMVSRIPLRSVKPERPVVSDRGDAYRVGQRGGLTTVRPEQDFSLLGHLAELRQLGCGRFLVELAHLGPFSPAGRQVLAALPRDQALPGTSPFNYLLGMT